MIKDRWCARPLLGTAPLKYSDSLVCEIYCSGCMFNCPGCQNAELQPFMSEQTEWMTVEELYNKVFPFLKNPLVRELHILGGEPCFNKNRSLFLSLLLSKIRSVFPDTTVLLFTGYNKEELPAYISKVLPYIDYIKCGRYIKELPIKKVSDTFELASNNQCVYKVENGKISGEEILLI